MVMKDSVEKAIEEFNKYFSPEATARLASISQEFIKIIFTGSFCYTCGFYEYFEDFKFLLKDLGLNARVCWVDELQEGAIVTFKVEGSK